MGDSAYTLDRDFWVPRENVDLALAAVNAAFERDFTDLVAAVEDLTSFEYNEIDGRGSFILGRHADTYLEGTTKLLEALGQFATEGSYVRLDGAGGDLFGFRVLRGRLREESGDYVWTMDPESSVDLDKAACAATDDGSPLDRAGALMAPMVFSRDRELFDAWWAQSARADVVDDLLALRKANCNIGLTLHELALETFQAAQGAGAWLRVQGLRPGLTASYLMLDIDPSYDSDGLLDGVNVVVTMHVTGARSTKYFQLSVYQPSPAQALVAASATESPREQLAEVVDAALAMVNAEIAERDDFLQSARDLSAPLRGGNVSGRG